MRTGDRRQGNGVQDSAQDEDYGDDPDHIIRHHRHFRQRQHDQKQGCILGEIAMAADLALQRRIVAGPQSNPVANAVQADQNHQYGLQDDQYGTGSGGNNRYRHWRSPGQ